ncbi:MAG: class I SAM-dependent methyltransferase [Anaerolineales bacterium]
MADWFSDEAFWRMFFPVLFPEERFDIAGEQVDKILALVDFEGNSVLDLACGPGRHSVELARKGLKVVGVDLSQFLLEKAKERANAAGVEVEWIHDDMRSFKRPASFDLCLSMFTSFGYFDEKKDDVAVIRNIYESLNEGGVCLVDVVGKEWLAKHFQPTTSRELDDGTLMIERHEIVDDWSRIRNRWIMLKEGKAEEYLFEHTVYSAQELKDRFADVGFGRVEVYGDLEGAEYGPAATRLIATARKLA